MNQRYREIAFTSAVCAAQAQNGSADIYGQSQPTDATLDELTPTEMTFIALRG